MSQYRKGLPQLRGGLFLTDGGIETTLIFHDGLELSHFAAFHLLQDEAGTAALRRYFARYAEIARAKGTGFILESPTWRASADWGEKLGYSAGALAVALGGCCGTDHRHVERICAAVRGLGPQVGF